MPDYKRLLRKKERGKKQRGSRAPSGRARSRIGIVLIFVALLAGIFFSLRSFLLNFPGLQIKQIVIVDSVGNLLPIPEDIFSLPEGVNLSGLNIKEVTQDIQGRHPELLRVTARKQFPDTLRIIAEKREPVAVVGKSNLCLVDKEGFALPYESSYVGLPKVVGILRTQVQLYQKSNSLRIEKAIRLIKELGESGVYPEYSLLRIDVSRFSDVVFYLQDGVEVKMGGGDFTRKAVLLNDILAQLKDSGSVPKYIDMRFGDPVVKP